MDCQTDNVHYRVDSILKRARNAEANISYVIIITNLNLNIKIKVAIRPNNRDKNRINIGG